jgi:hypothetical protein
MTEIVRCTNPCHDAPTDDGVDVRSVIEAAVAQGCTCLNDHCPAIINPLMPPLPLGDVSTCVGYEEPNYRDDQGDGKGGRDNAP